MTNGTLIRRSLRFHARTHFGVVLGAAIGSAALIGALLVGDSVRESLRQRALERLDGAHFALASPDRFFSQDLGRHAFQGQHGKNFFLQGFPSARTPTSDQSLSATLLLLPGSSSVPAGDARANHTQVFGVAEDFWQFVGQPGFAHLPKGSVVLNESLARQLGARKGDEVVLRVYRAGVLSTDAAISPRSRETVALHCTVAGMLAADEGGDLNLRSTGLPPMNAFVNRDELAGIADLGQQANLLLLGPIVESRRFSPQGAASFFRYVRYFWTRILLRRASRLEPVLAPPAEALDFLNAQLHQAWSLADAELKLEYASNNFGIELRSSRVFLEAPVVSAANRLAGTNATPILTYLANLMSTGTNATPYSMVTATGAPYTPPDLRDDEVVINQWLADDLHAGPGDRIALNYFAPESGAELLERTNLFRVRSVVPLDSIWADRTLMPDFPGIEKADNPRNWDAGFPLVYKIRPKDEDYWKKYRGTPKAFITLAAGQKMWGNRFGDLTAIRLSTPNRMATAEYWGRFKDQLLAALKPEQVGLRFEPVRDQALKAAEQIQDFGELFLSFSIFLVVAALLLMALLFQFGLEQRVIEIGTFLAMGFSARQVRRLLLLEGAILALLGGVIGAVGGFVYARLMLLGLATIWRSAIGSSALQFHASATSLATGMFAATIVGCFTIWLTLRKQARQPAVQLLAGEIAPPKSSRRRWAGWVAAAAGVLAMLVLGWAISQKQTANAEAFFGAGSLLLICGLSGALAWLGRRAEFHPRTDELRESLINPRTPGVRPSDSSTQPQLTLGGLAVRNCGRRRTRSVATMALLACGSFVILSMGVFRLDAQRDAWRRDSGTGGFALLGETTVPLAQGLNSKAGRDAFGLDATELHGVNVVPLRVRNGDEASCLNLGRAQQPRLLGVRPESLEGRFTFVKAAPGADLKRGWRLLQNSTSTGDEPVPAIGDANSIQWALGKSVGDTLDYTDDQGRRFQLRLVGAVANSVLQGSLVIDETEFKKRFPNESGYRMFLIDVPSNQVSAVSATLSRSLQDLGLELTPAARRLDQFNAVQNTYLGTFQVLGGLGMLLGSAGLGIIVLRNVLERRGELGLFVAVGFRRPVLQQLVLAEHGALLIGGLVIGLMASAVAVMPSVLSPGAHLPYLSLALTLGGVLLNGGIWAWAATRYALRGNLIAALRNE